jgi:hypothetical protein
MMGLLTHATATANQHNQEKHESISKSRNRTHSLLHVHTYCIGFADWSVKKWKLHFCHLFLLTNSKLSPSLDTSLYYN